jgi:hypothetical protein
MGVMAATLQMQGAGEKRGKATAEPRFGLAESSGDGRGVKKCGSAHSIERQVTLVSEAGFAKILNQISAVDSFIVPLIAIFPPFNNCSLKRWLSET